MKFFISYRFTGEDPKALKPLLASIQETLTRDGHKNYCSFDWQTHFEKNDFSNAQILQYSLHELEHADALLIFVNSTDKSEGMLLEIGYALALKKKLYLLIRKDVPTVFLRELVNRVIEFENTDAIPALLKGL